jgi:preprotein translocase subunit SecE
LDSADAGLGGRRGHDRGPLNVARVEIYKRNQGRYTRIVTFVAVMIVGVIGAFVLSRVLSAYESTRVAYVRYGIPTVVVAGLAVLMFWLVNRPTNADFLIATEGEMKKVSWSTKKEIIGSTKVVIITTCILSFILFAVDLMFTLLFRQLHIMGS